MQLLIPCLDERVRLTKKEFQAIHYQFGFLNLLYWQGSFKIIILGVGEGMVKLAHSYIAGGRGTFIPLVPIFWEAT